MAEHNKEAKVSASIPANHANNGTNPARQSMAEVNFEEMNFEQRRAPYNSGKRTIAERKYDKPHQENDTGHTRNEC